MTDPLSKASDDFGVLYVIATPIGNLGDITLRALETLKSVSLVLAEDTRHSNRLLQHYGINTQLKACHDHNEESLVQWVMDRLQAGENLGLISDAGTPLISDPGFRLVSSLQEANFTVKTVPGASSIIAALSIAGLPTDRFVFDGFLPAKSVARKQALSAYQDESRTVVVLESSHRIVASIQDLVEVLGGTRPIVLARELTKTFETVLRGPASDVLAALSEDQDQQRGEFVMLIQGSNDHEPEQAEILQVLKPLVQELPVKQAAALAAKIIGGRKNELYQLALQIKDSMQDD